MRIVNGVGLQCVLLGFGAAYGQTASAPAPGGEMAQRVAALKQSLAQSQKNLRAYQWVETTTVSLKGEVKSKSESNCYYGADGNLEKVPLTAAPPPETPRGLRGKIVERKKEELSDTMKQAVALIKTYVPPNATLIQRCKDAGKASLDILEPGRLVRLDFHDYQLPGDVLSVTIDVSTNRLSGVSVSTYLGKPDTPIMLDVQMGTLSDGTVYPANVQLVAKSQQLAVTVTNSGYRPLN
jgi:hypothetical protein